MLFNDELRLIVLNGTLYENNLKRILHPYERIHKKTPTIERLEFFMIY